MGTHNGCSDVINTAFISNWQYTLDSIMINSAISSEYKQAYRLVFFQCRQQAILAANPPITGGGAVHSLNSNTVGFFGPGLSPGENPFTSPTTSNRSANF